MNDNARSLPLVERIASSKAGAWFFVNVTSKVDPWLLKRTDGRFCRSSARRCYSSSTQVRSRVLIARPRWSTRPTSTT